MLAPSALRPFLCHLNCSFSFVRLGSSTVLSPGLLFGHHPGCSLSYEFLSSSWASPETGVQVQQDDSIERGEVRKESCFFFTDVTGECIFPGNNIINDGWGPRLVLNQMYHCQLHSGSSGLSEPFHTFSLGKKKSVWVPNNQVIYKPFR